MLGTMIFMVAFGMRSTKNFWSAGYFAVLAGFLVYKDKKAFQKATGVYYPQAIVQGEPVETETIAKDLYGD